MKAAWILVPLVAGVVAYEMARLEPAGGIDRVRIPNLEFRTQRDEAVRLRSDLVRERVVIMNFMFTTCRTFCPGATANLAKLQPLLGEHLGRDVVMMSVSVDPDVDTPARLKAYADQYRAQPGWYFLRGALEDVDRLRKTFQLIDPDDNTKDPTTHTGMVVYGSDARGIWRTASVLKKPADLARDVLGILDLPDVRQTQ